MNAKHFSSSSILNVSDCQLREYKAFKRLRWSAVNPVTIRWGSYFYFIGEFVMRKLAHAHINRINGMGT